MASPAPLSLAGALAGTSPLEPRGAPWQAAVVPTAASPAASTRSGRSAGASPRRLLLAESLAAGPPAYDPAAPTAPSEPPVRLSLFESLTALDGQLAIGSMAELAMLGPPPGLPAPPGLEDQFQAQADVERACSAFSDGWSSESTAAGSARLSERDSASRSPEPAHASARTPPFGHAFAAPEAEPFHPMFAALFGVSAAPADLLDTLGFAASLAAPPAEHAAHDPATCRPCAWFWKRVGCKSGDGCEYCHVCPDGALKDRKKVKRSELRADEAASPPAEKHQISLAALL